MSTTTGGSPANHVTTHLAWIVALAACGADRGATPAVANELVVERRAVPQADVIALVNGVAISLGVLREQLRGGRQDPSAALDDLIVEELLVQEALRRRIQQRPGIRRHYRRVLAQRQLETRFIERFKPSDIPEELVDRAYQLNAAKFDHPELAKVTQTVALAPPKDANKRTAARSAMAKLLERVEGKRLSVDEFKALSEPLRELYPDVQFRSETLVFPRKGSQLLEPFVEAAFSIAHAGGTSPIVDTRYGFHVIYLEERIPALSVPREEADKEIRTRIFDEARGEGLARYLQQLERETVVALFPERLQRAHE